MPHKTIFLDRDGVINIDKNYIYKIEDFEFVNGIFETCNALMKLNYKLIIITNQSGIGRGYFNETDFQKITQWMLNQFKCRNIDIHDIFYCPHGPKSSCSCRKPKPGMFIDAQLKHKIDMSKSWMIGDKESDIKASNDAGISNTILLKSIHENNEKEHKAKFIINNIEEVVNIITS
jgi:D-glycero-D-manno-heptose 1,7-bisphosphate phosphatase